MSQTLKFPEGIYHRFLTGKTSDDTILHLAQQHASEQLQCLRPSLLKSAGLIEAMAHGTTESWFT